jgi:hypothetical protein
MDSALEHLGRHDEAIGYHMKKLEFALQTGDISGQGKAHNGMGICLSNLGGGAGGDRGIQEGFRNLPPEW